MGIRGTTLLAVVAVLACAGAADKPADTKAGTKADAQKADAKKADSKKEDARKDAAPACMHCGATCGLEPVCVCEPGTKKRPKTEFETTCEPICIPRCGSHGWPGGDRPGCTSCTTSCAEPCECRSLVRSCKRLKKQTTDEEVPTTVRTVRYVCDRCAGRGGTGCCGAGPHTKPPSWWTNLTWWWPRTPTR